jgi:TetR/AcrR family transcriptional regulator, repressor of fatR-cypB operon
MQPVLRREHRGLEADAEGTLPTGLTLRLANANLAGVSSLPFFIAESDAPAKRAILRAAMKLFSDYGLAATSIRDIAKESGYTNPALYKHFASKEELALYLFEACHRRVWARCNTAIASASDFDAKLSAYVGEWLDLVDEHPAVMAFLSDSARALWPKASPPVTRQTMVGLARSLVREARKHRRGTSVINADIAAASLQGTLGEVARMVQVGVLAAPAGRWKSDLVALFQRILA